jgi:hypothetical protein
MEVEMVEVIIVVAAVASIATLVISVGRWLWRRLQAFRRARAEKAEKVDLLVRKVSELVERLNGDGE